MNFTRTKNFYLSVGITQDQNKYIKGLAKKHKTTQANIVRMILEDYKVKNK